MVVKAKKGVLFFCNDQTLCESIALYLSGWYPASCVRTFKDLEAHLAEHGASLLLLDLQLSEEPVNRVVRIKQAYLHIPIIVAFVYSRATLHLESQLRPVVDRWFYKPFDLDEIRKSVDAHLDRAVSTKQKN